MERKKKMQRRSADVPGKIRARTRSTSIYRTAMYGMGLSRTRGEEQLPTYNESDGPMTKHHQDNDDADARSTISEGSEENLAEEFAADAGTGLAMTGGPGQRYVPFFLSVTMFNTNNIQKSQWIFHYIARFPQCSSFVRG
jgi:hypothetical protein